jgi:hypothetical protein
MPLLGAVRLTGRLYRALPAGSAFVLARTYLAIVNCLSQFRDHGETPAGFCLDRQCH